MAPLLSGELSEFYRPAEQELSFGATSSAFCPSAPSSLIILSLSSPVHQAALTRASLSPGITRAYNSARPEARLKLAHNPGSEVLEESILPLLISRWKSNCGGQVIIEEVTAHDDIGQYSFLSRCCNVHSTYPTFAEKLFSRDLMKVAGPYTAIFTTSPFREMSSLARRALEISHPADQLKMPAHTTGVLWRYSFFSDYLIVGILVVVFLLIPPVLLGAHALTAIESPKGLKTRMVGAIAESKGNN